MGAADEPGMSVERVVVNDVGEHAIWLNDGDLSPGWRDVGVCGSHNSCVAYILEHWRDLRPYAITPPYPRAIRDPTPPSTDFLDATNPRISNPGGEHATGVAAESTQLVQWQEWSADAERPHALVDWNDTLLPFQWDEPVHHLFEQCADRAPHAVAVICAEQTLTYGELNARANQLAHNLRACGVGPDVPVAIYLERSVEMIVGILGIIKAGGAYVPLDPSYPTERLAFILEDVQAPLLLTQGALAQRLPRTDAQVICLDTQRSTIATAHTENPPHTAVPNDLVYIIYTSGSTGTPKGTMVEQRNLAHFVAAHRAYYQNPIRAFLMLPSFAFDASVVSIFPTLCGGATLVLPTEAESQDPLALSRLVNRHDISHLNCIASLYALLLAGANIDDLRGLDTVLVGGEACTRALVEDHFRKLPQVRLFNEYGLTETTVWCSVYQCAAADPYPIVPIGLPIPNMRLFVLDARYQPVPTGVPGELCVSGAGLCRGYHHRPDITAERFVPHPFPLTPGERMYRTGDRARFLPDGNLEFLGRIDEQVKIRGVRIEPGEIEAVLTRHPGLREAVVVARETSGGDQRLVAYIVPAQERAPGTGDLRQFLRERLPREMVPAAFVALSALPLTPNGKVDRQNLPAPAPALPDLERTFVAPCGDLEVRLAALWEEVLDVHPIGAHDNFFDIGGQSLLAIQVLGRINDELGTRLPVVTLFHAPTVAQFGRVVREEKWQSPWSFVVPMQPDGEKSPFFCVHGLGGSVLGYSELARFMRPDQPFYGIQGHEASGVPLPAGGLVEIATRYLQEVYEVQSSGPYYFGGFSEGGLLAFEMAQQVYASGEKMGLLVMLDAAAPSYWDVRLTVQFLVNFARDFPAEVREFAKKGVRRIYAQLVLHAGVLWRGIVRSIRHRCDQRGEEYSSVRLEYLRGAHSPDDVLYSARLREQLNRAYAALPFPGRITVIRSQAQRLWCTHERDLGWEPLACGGVEVEIVPGKHDTILYRPHVECLATRLQALLDAAQQRARGAG